MTPNEAKELLELLESGALLEIECIICDRPVKEHSAEEVKACNAALVPAPATAEPRE